MSTRIRTLVVLVLGMLITYTPATILSPEDDKNGLDGMNARELWTLTKDEARRVEAHTPNAGGKLKAYLDYLESPYPTIMDDGTLTRSVPRETPFQFEHCVSDAICKNVFAGLDFYLTDGRGNLLVGSTSEYTIGDQNSNGILEFVVFYFYIPWMSDGLDNDGDGKIDEIAGPGDPIPDGMVVYETGSWAFIGGHNGTLLVDVDIYSDTSYIEIFRLFITPPWYAYRIRSMILYPSAAGEFISYLAYEGANLVNANPEMDDDLRDWYVGSLDTRGFPNRPPVNNACSAGWMDFMYPSFERDDGWVVTTYRLEEKYDNRDWNGDGDMVDPVVAYLAIDPGTGDCRVGVNGAVAGLSVGTSGYLILSSLNEGRDKRDWNSDGDMLDYLNLYHDISTTWGLKGRIYRSYTFNPLLIAHQRFGFGWWSLYKLGIQPALPLRIGGVYDVYVGYSAGYYKSFFFLVSDEDNNRHTPLPRHEIGYGNPVQTHGGVCVQVIAREYFLRYAGVKLVGGIADGNGDGDTHDTLHYIFCPDQLGGHYVVDNTSKYAKGLYSDPIPFIGIGTFYRLGELKIDHLVTVPINFREDDVDLDCNNDGRIGSNLCSSYFQYAI